MLHNKHLLQKILAIIVRNKKLVIKKGIINKELREGKGQSMSSVSKQPVLLINMITSEIVILFKLFVLLSNPCRRFITLSLTFIYIFWGLLKSSHHWEANLWQCKDKYSIVSNPALHEHIEVTVSLKLYLNLCSYNWLNFILRHERSFIPILQDHDGK